MGQHIKTIGQYGYALHWAADLHCPYGLAIDRNSNLVVVDRLNHRIQIYSLEDQHLPRTFGTKGQGDGEMDNPRGIVIDLSGNIFLGDTSNNRIQVFGHVEDVPLNRPNDQPKSWWKTLF